MTVWLAGMRITALRLEDNKAKIVEQAADQTVTSSTTDVASAIVVPCDANSKYVFQLFVSYSADATGDIKWSWTMPAGASIKRFLHGWDATAAGGVSTGNVVTYRAPANTTAPVIGGTAQANFHSAHDDGQFITGTTAGNFTMAFSQGTSSATGTILRANTFVMYQKIG